MEIGNWVRREVDPDDENRSWHLVESIIADAAITRCGRRMEPEVDGFGLTVSDVNPPIDGGPICQAGCE